MEQGGPFCFTTHMVKTIHPGGSVSTSMDKRTKGERIWLKFYCGNYDYGRLITPQYYWKATLELSVSYEDKTTLTVTVETDNCTESWQRCFIPDYPETLKIEAFLYH